MLLSALASPMSALAQADPPADPGFTATPLHPSEPASPSAKLPEEIRAQLQQEIADNGLVRIVVGLASAWEPDAALQFEARKDPRGWLRRKDSVARLQDGLVSRLRPGIKVLRRLEHTPAIALEADERLLDTLTRDPDVSYIRQAILVRPTLNVSVPHIGADAPGLDGNGQAVAILDSGVDSTHGFLAGATVASAEGCFSSGVNGTTSLCPNGLNVQTGPGAGINCPLAVSGCDHGTHVAGIAAGAGVEFDGVAEGASIIPVQVFTRSDEFLVCGVAVPCAIAWGFDIDAGLEHVLNLVNAGSLPVDVAAVNMSLGGSAQHPTTSGCDDLSPSTTSLIDSLRTAGVATVIAAGNAGATTGMGWPACISGAISVGASDDFDEIASFSSRASWTTYFAPGVGIDSSVPGDGNFAVNSGTSMAAPHVAGAIAAIRADALTKGFVPSVDNVLAALATSGVLIDDVFLPVASDFTFPRIQVDAAASLFQSGLPAPVNVVIDDEDTLAGVVQTGVFDVFADTQAYRGEALEGVDAGVDTFRFTPTLPSPGLYRVYAWWPAATANTTRALFSIAHDEGTTSVELDQTLDGGQWNDLGVFSLGTTGPVYVEVTEADPAEPMVVVDAVRFELLPKVQVRTKDLPKGYFLTRYTGMLEGVYGIEPYSWTIVGGTLPAGLTLDGATGAISGTPTLEGTSNFTVEVRDALDDTATQALSMFIDAPPTGTTTLRISTDDGEETYFNGDLLGSSSNWRQASEYSVLLREGLNVVAVKGIDGGDLPTGMVVTDSSWKVQKFKEPGWAGLGFIDSGWTAATSYGQYGVGPWGLQVSGIQVGSPAHWIWSADNEADDEVYLRLSVNVARAPLAMEAASMPVGEVDQAFDVSLTASGGTGSYTWSVELGALPPGLILDALTGAISGAPTDPGTYDFTVQVRDGLGDTATQALSVTVHLAQATLRISADDGEDVYINGTFLGSSGIWSQGNEYTFPLVAGLNVLAVRGIDGGAGAGALIAELDLPTGTVVTDSSWKVHNVEVSGWENPEFDDAAWVGASSYGQYGVGPWGTAVAGFPMASPAQWIWSADNDGDDMVFFRYTIAVGPVALALQTTTLPAGEVEQAYDANLTAIGGSGSYSWSPAGLTLDAVTGAISGTPTADGTSSFTVQVQDGALSTATQALSITVDPVPPAQATLRISADNGEDQLRHLVTGQRVHVRARGRIERAGGQGHRRRRRRRGLDRRARPAHGNGGHRQQLEGAQSRSVRLGEPGIRRHALGGRHQLRSVRRRPLGHGCLQHPGRISGQVDLVRGQ
jgi:subtilisin family serine protease